MVTNHIHFLVTPSHEDSMNRMMQGIGRKFVRYVNDIIQRSGTLWETGFQEEIRKILKRRMMKHKHGADCKGEVYARISKVLTP